MNSKIPIIAVTGGNRGIGFEICRQLARRGAQVILTARKPEAGKQALAKLEREGLKAAFHPLEVTDEASVTALRDDLEKTFGRLDVLINNAGILADSDAAGLEVNLATVRTTLETNTLAPLHLAQMPPLASRDGLAGTRQPRFGAAVAKSPQALLFSLAANIMTFS